VAYASPLAAQRTREIRIVADAERDSYQFLPRTVTATAGDVLLFKVVSGAPHNVVFEAEGLSRRSRDLLNAALPRRTADLTGPLLVRTGEEYRVVVPPVPPGRYRYFCLPHRAYDERGELVIR
jgi:plastocyanin